MRRHVTDVPLNDCVCTLEETKVLNLRKIYNIEMCDYALLQEVIKKVG